MKPFPRIIGIIFLCSALWGCLDNDPSDCGTDQQLHDVTLEFSYTYHLGDSDLFIDQVRHIHMALYNKEGAYIADGQYVFSPDDGSQSVTIGAAEGEYIFVAWANTVGGHYTVEPGTTLTAMRLDMVHNGGVVTQEVDDLFYSYGTGRVTAGGPNVIAMPVYKNTSTVTLHFVPDPVSEAPANWDRIQTSITASNGSHSYDNSFFNDNITLTYTPLIRTYTDTKSATFKVGRFDEQADAVVTITGPVTSTGDPIVFSLCEMIDNMIYRGSVYRSNGMGLAEFIERCDNFEVTLNVVFHEDGDVSVDIGEWNEITDPGGSIG